MTKKLDGLNDFKPNNNPNLKYLDFYYNFKNME